ncbi:MAG: hypothetical protein AAF840_13320 [Bacteroidota bacterium]
MSNSSVQQDQTLGGIVNRAYPSYTENETLEGPNSPNTSPPKNRSFP